MKKDKDVRFNKFGTVSFTSITKVNDFIDHLKKGKVAGTQCNECGTLFFPPRADCCHCLSSNMAWFDISGTGTLVTYSKLKFAPMGFDDDLPYAIGVLDYGDYKVFGRISSDVAEGGINIGMHMKVAANALPNGQINYVFQKA
jgi:uncharacterized OB-fold protein